MEGKAVGIEPAVEEEVGSIGVVVEGMVFEVGAVVLPEEEIVVAVGDNWPCSLLWDTVALDD